MSAITGIDDCETIVFNASASCSRGTATRTMSAPASATVRICSIVARTLAVSVLVIVCTATGAPPPTGSDPIIIWRLEATAPLYGAAPDAGEALGPTAERLGHLSLDRARQKSDRPL